jgi:TetR/AcrR family transcriptional regulator, cholesterol catabolism regulator
MTSSLPKARPAAPSPNPRRGRPAALAPQPEGLRDLVSQLKRERIVSAAIDLFYRQGYGQTTLDQVAKALGMTKPFIYQYFRSKNELLVEICTRALKDAHETLSRLLSQQGTASEKLRIIVRDFTLSVLNNQANAVIYSREETELAPRDRAMINQLRRDFDRRIVVLLEEGIAAGELSMEDVRVTSFVIASMVGWSPVWFRAGGRLTKEQAAERVASLVLKMVGAPTP